MLPTILSASRLRHPRRPPNDVGRPWRPAVSGMVCAEKVNQNGPTKMLILEWERGVRGYIEFVRWTKMMISNGKWKLIKLVIYS